MIEGTLDHRRCDRLLFRPLNPRADARKRMQRARLAQLAALPDFKTGGTFAETCWLNRDRFPAIEIGRRMGITRNAVIGHWFRWRLKHGEGAQ